MKVQNLISLLSLALLGCEARFVDYRSPEETPPPSASADMAKTGGVDVDLGGTSSPEKLLAKGTFMGRAGHSGSGEAQLYRRADGAIEVRLGADFIASDVPAPALYLSSRSDIGTTVDPQSDILLGTPTYKGAQTFLLPKGAEVGRRSVFDYCKTFRVEVAKATLVDLP